MARAVAGDYLRDATPIFSPTARPVDTYVRPAQKESASDALLRALGGLDDAVTPVLSKMEKDAQKEELAEGQKVFMQNRADFRDAVTSGAIPAGASPYVRKGYRRAQLHTLGANYATELASELETSDIYKIDDPAEVEEFLKGYHQKFAEANGLGDIDPVELAESFSPLAQRAHDSFRVRQTEKNIQFVEAERLTAFEGEVLSIMDLHTFGGSRSQVAGAVTATAEFLTAKAKELDEEGIDRAQINDRVIGMIVAAAVEREDTDILNVLKQVKLGTAPIYNTAAGRKAVAQAERAIISASNARAARARAAQAAAEKARVQELETKLFDATVSGEFDINSPELQELKRLDAGGARQAVNWNEARKEAMARDDQKVGFGYSRESIMEQGTYSEALRTANRLVQEDLISTSDADQALGDYRSIENTPQLKRLLGDGFLNDVISRVQKVAGGAGAFGAFQDPERAAESAARAQRVVIEWYNENRREDGSVNYDDFINRVSQVEATMMKIYGSGGDGSTQVEVPDTKVAPDGTAVKITDIPD